jgi:hypothetical protein
MPVRYETCPGIARVRAGPGEGPQRPDLRVDIRVYVRPYGIDVSAGREQTMVLKTAEAWGLAILGVMGLVLALNSLGVDVTAVIGTVVRGSEHILDQPLAV